MSRPVFGVTDSPRLAKVKRKIAARARALRSPESPHVAVIERGPTGEPERLVFVRNPHYRKPPVYHEVCWDGGGRCTPRSCEIAEGCTGPVPNPLHPANASGVRDAR